MSKQSPTEQWQFNENRIKRKEDINFNSVIFNEPFLNSRYEYAMSELMMSSPHNFPSILFTEMIKIPVAYFSYEKVKLALNEL